ncbi:MAG: CSLREA domain-containing protein, partial [Anaerolineales bacterium]
MKRQRILTVVLILSMVVLSAGNWNVPTDHAAVITVNTTDDELNSDSDCSLREAIQAANSDSAVSGCAAGSGVDIITLPAGFYTLTIPGTGEDDNATGDLDITSDLTINGEVGSTIIQAGTNLNNGIDRVLDIHNAIVDMNHLWIEYGKTPNTPGEIDGGGIRNSYGTLTLNNSYVSSNSGHWRGGGIYSTGGMLTLNNTTVGSNNADVGGGIFNQSHTTMTLNSSSVSGNNAYDAGGIRSHGTLTLTNTTVSANVAEHDGGGISNGQFSTLKLENSTVSTNTAERDGGGIHNRGSMILDNSNLIDNTADSDHDLSGNGGGIWNEGPLDVYNSAISNNNATYGGGIYINGDITLILSKSTVADNVCAYNGAGIYNGGSSAFLVLHRSTIKGNDTGLGNGGGIYHGSGDMTLNTCTVSGNTSGNSGGGIYTAGTLTLNNSTIAHNAADVNNSSGDGGGIYISNGLTQAKNTIIGNNSDRFPQTPDCWGTLTSQGYNLLENTTGCSFTPTTGDITGSDPKLSSLGDNGGPTWTHALQTGSPAIEKIPDGSNGCMAGVSTDQRSYLRAGGVGYGGSLCDIGSYEY